MRGRTVSVPAEGPQNNNTIISKQLRRNGMQKGRQKAQIQSKQRTERQRVTFSFESPHASKVILLGDFNNWDPKVHPMKRDGNGNWKKTILIPPGKYEYKFLADDQWVEDPCCVQNCPNGFGTFNSVLTLPPK